MVDASLALGDMIRTGILILARNPWLSGKLKTEGTKHGIVAKKRIITRNPPPWAKSILHFEGLSPAQLDVIKTFIEKVREGKERGEIGPGKLAPIYIKSAMTGFRSGRMRAPPRRPKTNEELAALASRIERMIARREVAAAAR